MSQYLWRPLEKYPTIYWGAGSRVSIPLSIGRAHVTLASSCYGLKGEPAIATGKWGVTERKALVWLCPDHGAEGLSNPNRQVRFK